MLNMNGSPCLVANIASKLFPDAAQELKKFYLPSVSSPFTTNVSGQGTPGQNILSIKTAADKGKNSTTAQGLSKLNRFSAGAVLDYETGMASKLIYAIFDTAIKVTLEKPHAARKVALRSIAERTFDLASKYDR